MSKKHVKEFAELITRLDQSNKTSDKLEALGEFFAKAADSDNLLLKQANNEAINQQMEKDKLMLALEKVNKQKIEVKYPLHFTPFAFPIMVDRLRASLSSESLEDQNAKIQALFAAED